jgi:hypothetical protein
LNIVVPYWATYPAWQVIQRTIVSGRKYNQARENCLTHREPALDNAQHTKLGNGNYNIELAPKQYDGEPGVAKTRPPQISASNPNIFGFADDQNMT